MRQGLNRKMSDAHEKWLVSILGGRITPGSGSSWSNQMDGRHNHYTDEGEFSFAWDGKSTLGKSVTITRDMIEKAIEQAASEEPMLAFRFYANEELDVDHDWIAVKADVFADMLERVRG